MYNHGVDMPRVLLRIEYGSYFGGACEITLMKRDEKTAICCIEGYNGWKMDTEEFTFPSIELKRIEQAASPIKAWKEKYEPHHEILDGHGWTIESYFGEMIKREGYMKYPKNYSSVMNGILNCIESIRIYGDGETKNIPLLSPD